MILSVAAFGFGSRPTRDRQDHRGELRVGSVVFRFPPSRARAAEFLAGQLGIDPRLLGLPEDILSRGEIIVELAPDLRAFDALAPGAPDWSAGVAFPEGNRIVLPVFGSRIGGTPLATILRHELAHVGLNRHVGASVPRWFHEGYAQVVAGSWSADDAWALRLAILAGRVSSLESLSLDFRRERLSADHAYLLSYTAVERLHRLGGEAGFASLLNRWHETGDLDRAIRRTFGMTLAQFERLWRRDVKARYGWLLLVTQATVYWTALTIILLILGYWKRQRDRRKMEALLAREREAPEGEEEWWASPEGTQDN